MVNVNIISSLLNYSYFHESNITQVLARLLSNEEAERAGIASVNKHIGSGIGHVTTFIGLRGSQDELKLPSSNLWRLPCDTNDYNLNKMVHEYHSSGYNLDGEKEDDIFFFAGFPSAKDPSYNERCPGKSVACVITEAREDHFEQWMDKSQVIHMAD